MLRCLAVTVVRQTKGWNIDPVRKTWHCGSKTTLYSAFIRDTFLNKNESNLACSSQKIAMYSSIIQPLSHRSVLQQSRTCLGRYTLRWHLYADTAATVPCVRSGLEQSTGLWNHCCWWVQQQQLVLPLNISSYSSFYWDSWLRVSFAWKLSLLVVFWCTTLWCEILSRLGNHPDK